MFSTVKETSTVSPRSSEEREIALGKYSSEKAKRV